MIDLKRIKSKHQCAERQADVRPTVQSDVRTLHGFIPENWVIENLFMGGCMTEQPGLVSRPKKRMMDRPFLLWSNSDR